MYFCVDGFFMIDWVEMDFCVNGFFEIFCQDGLLYKFCINFLKIDLVKTDFEKINIFCNAGPRTGKNYCQ